MVENYKLLVDAIINKSLVDYKFHYKCYKRGIKKPQHVIEMFAIKSFFKSEYFKNISGINDVNYILEQLQKIEKEIDKELGRK